MMATTTNRCLLVFGQRKGLIHVKYSYLAAFKFDEITDMKASGGAAARRLSIGFHDGGSIVLDLLRGQGDTDEMPKIFARAKSGGTS